MIIGDNAEFVGQTIGGAFIPLIIMNLVFKPFDKGGSRKEEKNKGLVISILVALIISFFTDQISLLSLILAIIVFYISKVKKFEPLA